ncbi:sulfotransferase ssu-1-like [Clavelina lepadiformis]|uniref:sulfotransferase ssu-1-like n=1 Tax=Clavelina lepadiformis TaxID=159417 RepID=UPI004041D0A4
MDRVTNKRGLKLSSLVHPVTGRVCLYPPSFEQSDFNSALQYKAESTDVFVCSFPKSGTTWLQNIVWLITRFGEPIPGKVRNSMPMLEFDGAEQTEQFDNAKFPRIVKTHFPVEFVPQNTATRYLYIARNPKDVVVSYYFHTKGFQESYGLPSDFTVHDLVQSFIEGHIEFNDYFKHVSDWFNKRDEENVLFLLYENLIKDARNSILKIARFIGQKYEKALLESNGQLLDKILEESSFKVMKNQDKWFVTKRRGDIPFIRKGGIGDWKNHVSSDDAVLIDQVLLEKGREIFHLWDDYPEIKC